MRKGNNLLDKSLLFIKSTIIIVLISTILLIGAFIYFKEIFYIYLFVVFVILICYLIYDNIVNIKKVLRE